MRSGKIRIAVLSLLLLTLAAILALTGCNEATVSDIYVPKTGMPKTVYVQGQDLDLTGGVITVVTDGAESTLPMTDENVSVTGYDRDKLGKQTLTVSYKEKTVSLEVTVIARIVADSYEQNYFVGDVFDANKGKMRIARDNGTTFTVNLNDKGVEITSFDSSKAGKTAVGVKYTANDGKVYEGSFNVTVHAIGNVKFTAPYKKSYSSHELEVDVAGSYFTVTSDSDASFQRYVPVTKEMVTGYEPSAVTIENRDTPVNQTLVFKYAGKEFEFPITVIFSPLSIFNERAKELAAIDWNKETVTIEDEQGAAAIDAIKQYYKLTDGEKKLIDQNDLKNVVRPAAVYINRQYFAVVEKEFANVLTVSGDGVFSMFADCTYDEVKSTFDKISDEEHLFNVYGKLLSDIKESFPNMVFRDDIKVASYIVVVTEEDRLYLLDLLDHMMNLYNMFVEIPDDWTIETLAEHSDAINNAVTRIRGGQFVGTSYSFFYSIVSSWRENDDFFDIIYSYYLYGDEDIKSLIVEELWMQVPLPGILEDWYIAIMNAFSEEQYMLTYAESDAYLHDVTVFMYYYFETARIAEQIKASDNTLYTDLYEFLTCDLLFDQYLRNSTYGYLYHSGEMLDEARFMNVWSEYTELFNYYINEFDEENLDPSYFENTFLALYTLTPRELNAFINSMHFLYDSSRGNVMVFDYEENAYSYLIFLLGNYYTGELGEDAAPLFQQLLLAMENCSLIGIKETATEDFKAAMVALLNGRAALSTEKREAFNAKLGKACDKYAAIYNELIAEEKSELDESWSAKFAELYELLAALERVDMFLSTEDETVDKDGVHSILFALYERAEELYADIVKNGDNNVIKVLATKEYDFAENKLTLDGAFFSARAIFIRYMIYSTITVTDDDGVETVYMAWDLYKGSNFRPFLADLAHVYKAYFEKTEIDAGILDLMAAFRALDKDTREMLFVIDSDGIYYGAICAYLEGVLAADEALVAALLEVERLYCEYDFSGEDEDLTAFCDKVAELETLYASVSDKETFDTVLGDMYTYYVSLAATDNA